RIRGRYVKSDAPFAARQPAKCLVLQLVISHSALHHPLPRYLPMQTITHPTLVQLVASGAVRVVVAVGQPNGWSLLVRYGLAERALAAQRSKQLRIFRKLDTLQAYLETIGVCHFEVDAAGFIVTARKTNVLP
ncbi:MAG: hypothetical protein ACRDBT_10520, partial [Aeromonas sp.]